MDVNDATRSGTYLLILTALLVAVGCVLYVLELVGVAQLFWVVASGAAGAAIALIVGRDDE